jgi:hypothetical protein
MFGVEGSRGFYGEWVLWMAASGAKEQRCRALIFTRARTRRVQRD